MLVLAAVFVLVALGIWLFCLFDVLATDEGDARHLPKFAWFLIVLCGFEFGAIAWLLFGRRCRLVTADVATWPADLLSPDDVTPLGHSGRPAPSAPLGPDDDPEFLRRLDRRLRGDDPS